MTIDEKTENIEAVIVRALEGVSTQVEEGMKHSPNKDIFNPDNSKRREDHPKNEQIHPYLIPRRQPGGKYRI